MALQQLISTAERKRDAALSTRASTVIPGGMYGHLSRSTMPPSYPQFFASGEGTHLWDVDGNRYLDLMCAWGPMILGYRHPAVEAAYKAQLQSGDCLNGPGPAMVELAELLVDTVAHADWAMFAKNGNDATTLCLTIARAATGRSKVLKARHAYHGAAPWCSPSLVGVTAADRANIVEFDVNDLADAERAAGEAGADVAAIISTPYKHDGFVDQVDVDPTYARGLRALADRLGAALVLDDVRCGFRYDTAGSWEPVGVRPDLSAFSKAIANGHPLAAVTGTDALRQAASSVFATGSFWFAAAPMAAAIATLTELRDGPGLKNMHESGQQLRDGLAEQAARYGCTVHQTGPVQMPFLRFEGDLDFEIINRWCTETIQHGLYVHPWHNWFMSAAHTAGDIEEALAVTDRAFEVVATS